VYLGGVVVSSGGALALFLMFPICTIVLMVWVKYMIEGVIMSSAQDVVDQVVEQLGRVRDEIVGEIEKLEAAAAAGETLDLTALTEAAKSLDDIVPDSVEPVDEPATPEA
jgi:hypothetical protein